MGEISLDKLEGVDDLQCSEIRFRGELSTVALSTVAFYADFARLAAAPFPHV
jgi:hypothetical protein